jgi:hypothetical protein
MKRIAALASIVAVAVAGCATSGDPGEVAARECGYFARAEGARVIGVDGVDAVSEGDANYKVRLKVEDGMSRRTTAACLYSSAGNKARWAEPLPSGFIRI